MNNYLNRITRIEEGMTARAGCDDCLGWDGNVIVDDDGQTSRPERCAACGRSVPVVTVVAITGIAVGDI